MGEREQKRKATIMAKNGWSEEEFMAWQRSIASKGGKKARPRPFDDKDFAKAVSKKYWKKNPRDYEGGELEEPKSEELAS